MSEEKQQGTVDMVENNTFDLCDNDLVRICEPSNKVVLNRLSKVKVVAPSGHLGVILRNKECTKGTIVSTVRTSSSMAGKIFPGDQIIAVDEEDVSQMTVAAFNAIMTQKNNSERTLTVLTEPKKAVVEEEEEEEVTVVSPPVGARVKRGSDAILAERCCSKLKLSAEDSDDDEVMIVDPPPVVSTIKPGKNITNSKEADAESDDIEVVGTVNSLNLPHMRCHCTVYPHIYLDPFDKDYDVKNIQNKKFCDQCYCYVCDALVKDCKNWMTHCEATDKSHYWKTQRTVHIPAAFEACLADGRIWKTIVSCISGLVRSGEIKCNQEGITLHEMDRSSVALCELFLPASYFSKYSCREGNVILDIEHFGRFSSLLSKIRLKDGPTMIKATPGKRLQVSFPNAITNPSFILLRDEGTFEPNEIHLNTDYKCKVVLKSSEFKKIIQTLQSFHGDDLADYVTISCTGEGIKFTHGGEHANYLIKPGVASDGTVITSIDCDEFVSGMFSYKYLNIFLRVTTLSPNLTIFMNPEGPIKFEYSVGDGYIRFYLSPKVNDYWY